MTHSADREAELSTLTSRGGLYLGLRYGLGILVSFGNMLVLTRWIGPHAYGLYVTALGLTSFLAALGRGGIDTYLVRMDSRPDQRAFDVATTMIVMFSMALIAVGGLVVPLLARWFGNREFVPAYLVTLLTVPLAGLAGPPTAKLERELNYRAVASIELGGQILALVVGMVLAWRGYGVWAPVLGLLAWQAWAAGAALKIAGLRPRVCFDVPQARQMFSFGIGYSSAQRVWQMRTLVNPLLVGKFAGADGVAYVALAIRIAEGLGFVRVTAGRLAIAALSRLRRDPARFQSQLQGALKLQVLALGPLLCLFSLLAPWVVPRFLGLRWMPSLQVYPFVAAGVLVNSVYNLQASALFVHGGQWIVVRAYAAHVTLLAVVTLVLLPALGIVGYAWADVAACAGYAILHSGGRRVARICYRSLGWLACAFLLPPFALLFRSAWSVALWTPLLVVAVVQMQAGLKRARPAAIGDDSKGRTFPAAVYSGSPGAEA